MGSATTGEPFAAEAPWLAPVLLERLEDLHRSHQQAFAVPLLAGDPDRPARLRAQELFAAPLAVLAHDGGEEPRLIYANRFALNLWRRTWAEMIGLPSRLTAEPQERQTRAEALEQALQRGAIRGYGGIRVDRDGRRFRIEGARIWSLIDTEGRRVGQAAAFASCWWL